jgi:2-methyl-3-hydroxypyridine 5-carboxylic acid dioxygenase
VSVHDQTMQAPAPSRRAEVAGAGFAGLTVAAALAQRGWSVRLHEQNDTVRDFGAGIVMWRNAMLALEVIGVAESVREHGVRPDYYETFLNGASVSLEVPGYPYWAITRPKLHSLLADAARAAGVEIVTSSRAVGADPAGALLMADGSRLQADLVIGTDGAGSAVRNSLSDLTQERKKYSDGVCRVLIPRPQEFRGERWNRVLDYWTLEPDAMRVLYHPMGPDMLYIAFMAETKNERASRIPVDVEVWSERFPHLIPIIELAGQAEGGRHDNYQTNRVTPWSTGRAALVGDAAHAMCPALGQGAGVGMVNAVDLAYALDQYDTVAEALSVWEGRMRQMTDDVQSRSAYMAETRNMAKGNNWTPRLLETANFVSAAVPPAVAELYPVPEANRSW